MSDATSMGGRMAAAIRLRGVNVTLRQVARAAGAIGLPNPPTLSAPVVDGAVAAGATSLALRAQDAVGRLMVGDILVLGTRQYKIGAETAARSAVPGTDLSAFVAGFDAIPVTPALPAIADGTTVSFIWQSDTVISAIVQAYPAYMLSGSAVQATDLQVLISAFGLAPIDPLTTRIIVPDGTTSPRERTIESIKPSYIRGEIVRFEIQAR